LAFFVPTGFRGLLAVLFRAFFFRRTMPVSGP
jgi:hypothetical protein